MGQPHPRPHRSPALRRRRGRDLRPADPRMLPHAARQTHRMRDAGLAVERVRAHRMAGPTARRTARIPAGQQKAVRPIAHQPDRHEPDRQRRAHLPAQRSAGRTLLGPATIFPGRHRGHVPRQGRQPQATMADHARPGTRAAARQAGQPAAGRHVHAGELRAARRATAADRLDVRRSHQPAARLDGRAHRQSKLGRSDRQGRQGTLPQRRKLPTPLRPSMGAHHRHRRPHRRRRPGRRGVQPMAQPGNAKPRRCRGCGREARRGQHPAG